MFMLQLSILLSINLLSAVAQSDETLAIAQYRLRVDPVQSGLGTDWQGGTDVVSYANSSLWVGGIKYEIYSEPFTFQSDSQPTTSLLFTSYHSAPTDAQYVYIGTNFTLPLFSVPGPFNLPSSGAFDITGFEFDSTDRLSYRGRYNFVGCRNIALESQLETYKIWWAGGGQPPNGTMCTPPLFLYRDTNCTVSG
ncbi:hypothetical protein MMC15_008424 [Xylographa vitiligo]|nr:hypothetical protein [Xylographa vitiligo]